MIQKHPYNGPVIEREALFDVYRKPFKLFTDRYWYSPRDDVKVRSSALWDEKFPSTEEEYLAFYRHEQIIVEELAWWYQKDNCRRMSRAIYAGSIARDYGCTTFAEFGCGLGVDAKALSMQNLTPVWLGDICLPGLEMAKAVWDGDGPFVDLMEVSPVTLPPADLLFSSDALEHVRNPELTLAPWIHKYRLVIVYAPFNNREGQHSHTTYQPTQFHSFMAKMGFTKVVYNLAVPPFVYVRK